MMEMDMMMGGGLIAGLLVAIPFWKILPRYGISSWVAIAAIIPLIAVILLWVIAFRDKIGDLTK